MKELSARRVVFVVHPYRPGATELVASARRWWEARGFEVLEHRDDQPTDPAVAEGELTFALSFGGDGTMLRTVQLVIDRGVPVLGINLGRLGYLTQVEPSEMEDAFGRLISGVFDVEERMTLDVSTGTHHYVALNEAAVEKTSPGHTIRLAMTIAGRPFLTYAADGMVVATPTGSTAYNLSLRGPIVSPRLRALVVTPISPHMLFDRSLVLEPEEWISLQVLDERPAELVIDGTTSLPLVGKDEVVLRAGPRSARVVRFGTLDFHAILRHKFGLTDR